MKKIEIDEDNIAKHGVSEDERVFEFKRHKVLPKSSARRLPADRSNPGGSLLGSGL
jgi:hypothetical protein